MKGNREQIYEFVKLHSSVNANHGISTNEIAEALGMQRTNVSTALGELLREGRVKKSSSRPVLYSLTEAFADEEGAFRELVGYDGSLKYAVQLARAALLYPHRGLNVLLIGREGSGRKYMAEVMHKAAVQQGLVAEQAPFVMCDCMDFGADDAATIAELFGDGVQGGMLAEAATGILFLHKVQFLSVNVRRKLLRCFVEAEDARELPMIFLSCDDKALDVISLLEDHVLAEIRLPSLTERPLPERRKLLEHFLVAEACRTKRTITLESEVLTCLMLFPCEKEILTLKTQIRKACMNAYLRDYMDHGGELHLYISDFDPSVRKGFLNYRADKEAVDALVKPQMRYSYQEYFERMTKSPRTWGKPLGALLGALKMQVELGLPSIGGKDSMSGTFEQINVPPMLMAFGITTVDAGRVISTDFKKAGHSIYLVRHTPLENHMPDTGALKRNFDFVSSAIESGKIVSGYAVGFGGVAEALAKMSFGNGIGADVEVDEATLFDNSYGSIVVESTEPLDFPAAELLGHTEAEESLTINGEKMPLEELYRANTERFATVYPDKGINHAPVMEAMPALRSFTYPGEAVERPVVFIPVFPGSNCDYDTAKAFRRAGAEVRSEVFCNLTAEAIFDSIRRMKEAIAACHIFVLCGGFSAGDEPDGSGKFIANVLNNKDISEEIHRLLDRGGLILGICNGFQALVKSGLLPYGRLGLVTKESPTLFRNDINRHVSQIVSTRVATTNSPWLSSFSVGDIHSIAVSHGEGKFVVNEPLARELFENGQVAFQYVDAEGRVTAEAPYNPNGSYYAIEGIVSRDGQILGKMGHTERYGENLFKNIAGEKVQDIFTNAVNYFRKTK